MANPYRSRSARLAGLAVKVVAVSVAVFLVAPLLILIPISLSSGSYLSFPPPGWSLQWYERYLGDPFWIDATFRSLQIGLGTAVLALIIGLPLAFGLARGKFLGRALIESSISIPIIVPSIVFSIGSYSCFVSLGLVGEWYGVVVAHTVLALPFVTIVLLTGLRTIDGNLEVAARGLGASRLKTVAFVTLPLIATNLYQAAFLAFITSFDELVVAMFLAGQNMTLPKKMFDDILNEIEPTVAAVSVLQILMVCALLAFYEILRRLRGGARPLAA